MRTAVAPILLLMFTLAACGQDEAVTAPPQTEPPAEKMPLLTDEDLAAEEAAQKSTAEAPVVYFVAPENGAEVTSPVLVKFGLKGMDVAPAGTQTPNTGHHHLLIDVDELPAMDQPIPSDENHRHFGKGQTEVSLELAPGKHTLRLLLGDGSHVPHDPALVSELLTITVVE